MLSNKLQLFSNIAPYSFFLSPTVHGIPFSASSLRLPHSLNSPGSFHLTRPLSSPKNAETVTLLTAINPISRDYKSSFYTENKKPLPATAVDFKNKYRNTSAYLLWISYNEPGFWKSWTFPQGWKISFPCCQRSLKSENHSIKLHAINLHSVNCFI